MTNENKVELRPAHAWDCPNCSETNYCEGEIVEFTQEDREAMKEDYPDVDPENWQTGMMVTTPEEVMCSHCGAEFGVADDPDDPNEGEREDGDEWNECGDS